MVLFVEERHGRTECDGCQKGRKREDRRGARRTQAGKEQGEQLLTATLPAAAPPDYDLGLADVTMLVTDTSSAAGFVCATRLVSVSRFSFSIPSS